MKLAICFYGQPRSAIFCSKLNQEVFRDLENRFAVDYFIHNWTLDTGEWGFDEQEKVNQSSVEKCYEEEYCPKAISFEDPKLIVGFSDPLVWRATCHYYTMTAALNLVQRYVLKTATKYDYILLLRPDMWYREKLLVGGLKPYLEDPDAVAVIGQDANCKAESDRYLRDEGFGFNQKTAFIFSGVFSYFLSRNVDHFNRDLLCPEVCITDCIEYLGLTRCKQAISWDRVLVRQPSDLLLDPTNSFHREILLEIREWVDWCTNSPKMFKRYVECRLAGLSVRNSLEILTKEDGPHDLDFIVEFEKGPKF